MMMRPADARRDAPALRFLLGCVGGWALLRMMMLWNPALSAASTEAPMPLNAPSPFAGPGDVPSIAPRADAPPVHAALDKPSAFPAAAPIALDGDFAPATVAASGGIAAYRHDLRPALMVRLLPAAPGNEPHPVAALAAVPWHVAASHPAPAQGEPFWMQRQMAGWSAAGWIYLRDGSGETSRGIGASSQLGGSQGGVRLGYGFGAMGRLRAYARATMAVARPEQREAAFGLAFAPLARVPIDVAIEQRVAVGREGRTALAVMTSGGVSDVALPAGFRLDVYAQAGVVGARRRDAFADGAVVVDRGLGPDDASLRLGALAAGAVQPGAARVDVGPRLTLRLPEVGKGSRIALDWRLRVAGDAQPESGLALTLAADF